MLETVDLGQLHIAAQRGCTIIDVREPHEYHAGHVPGAKSLPATRIPAAVAELPHTRPVYLVCESGNRSARAAQYLSSRGLQACTVAGGTSAWRAAGLPVRAGGLP